MNDQQTDCPMPEEVGDVYALLDYPAPGLAVLGYAYCAADPTRPNHWCWWLSLDDGDQYPWLNTADLLDDTSASTVILVRRQMVGLEDAVRQAVPADYLPALSIRPYFGAVLPAPPEPPLSQEERDFLSAHGIDLEKFS